MMNTSTISIEIDSDTARTYANAPLPERRKLELLLGARLRDLTSRPHRPLGQVMDEMGAHAKQQELTLDALDSLLHGE